MDAGFLLVLGHCTLVVPLSWAAPSDSIHSTRWQELKKQRKKEKERLDQDVADGAFDADSAALAAMGLPTGFGGGK